MDYRLAFDMGSSSIGWCLLKINKDKEPIELIDLGTRIFSDGRNAKDQTPLSVIRRNARNMRRRLDRRKKRLTRLRSYLQKKGFFPEDMSECRTLVTVDPFEWRVKSLDEKIPLTYIGRILMHICKHRGFLSNRKIIDQDNTDGKIKEGICNLNVDARLAMDGYRTLGEYLWTKLKDRKSARYRINLHENEKCSGSAGSKKQYVEKWDLYPQRSMLEKEVEEILAHQSKFHKQLNEEVCEEIKDIIFFQRPLKPVIVGNCTFESYEKRARKAYPIVQKSRILQEVNNLQLLDNKEHRELGDSDKKLIAEKLYRTNELKFSDIRRLLKLPKAIKFNLEQKDKKSIKGDSISASFSQRDIFGDKWFSLSLEEQNEIIDKIFNSTHEIEVANNAFNKWKCRCDSHDPAAIEVANNAFNKWKRSKNEDKILVEWLEQTHALTSEQARKCLEVSLVLGYSSLSLKAIEKILRFLEAGMKYYEACKEAGYHQEEEEFNDALPYYGACLPESVIGGTHAQEDKDNPERYFGKINNSSVHIALNQLRQLTNAIIKKYGLPEQIIIELARELKQKPADIIKEQKKNKAENETIDQELAKLKITTINYDNRLKYKLWKELKSCPFCGKSIGKSELFSDQSQFEIEHILPFSLTLNDRVANKVISCRKCNRRKGNRTPYEAFGDPSPSPQWNEILERIKNLPENKRWRFKEDALERAKKNNEDIIARLLTDTQYMSRMAQRYLKVLYTQEERASKVMATSGQVTSLLRRKWGLNGLLKLSKEQSERKERGDHRHHAIDAFVIGCTTRKMLERLSAEANKVWTNKDLYEQRQKLVEIMPEPYSGYLKEVREKLGQMIVSHRPDHRHVRRVLRGGSTVAVLHKETAYGLITDPENKEQKFVTRKPIELFTEKDIDRIVDPVWRKKLSEEINSNNPDLSLKKKLEDFSKKQNLRRLRVFSRIVSKQNMISIYRSAEGKDRDPKPYKYYESGNNYCAEIYCPSTEDKKGEWLCEIITNYQAHQREFISNWRKEDPTAKLIMRLQINDMVAYEENGSTRTARVKKMSMSKVCLVDHNIANDKKFWVASASQLKEKGARKVYVDIMGQVKDPRKLSANFSS
jgi:CRISPR-associated endonuclease Csn1